MNYIVLDLEWNQPTSYQSSAYRKVGNKLLFEVIQIGAAKLDDDMNLLETISLPVHPSCYLTIHPRVRRMTGLDNDVLCDAPLFPEACKQFLEWCGRDSVFITWGCDDISVLKQNMTFFEVEGDLPKAYDLQPVYAKSVGKSGQTALKTAMEALNLTADEEEKPFHNAENDAYYTALVFQHLKDPKAVLEKEVHPRVLAHSEKSSRIHVTDMIHSVSEALASEKVAAPICPKCGKLLKRQTELIPQAPGRYLSLWRCSQHGVMLQKLQFALLPDGQKGMKYSLQPSNQQTRAYVHTKELQYQQKRKRGEYDNVDIEDLSQSSFSNMPFEDS